MIVIETCPKCGHDLFDSVICANPPIPKKECHNCGWSWEGQREEEIVRVPFNENNTTSIIEPLQPVLDEWGLRSLDIDLKLMWNKINEIVGYINQ